MQTSSLRVLATTALVGCLGWGGCSDSTDPTRTGQEDSEVVFGGAVDPEAGGFVLERIEQLGPLPLFVELVGSNLELEPGEETVSLDVAIRNVGADPLLAPAAVWVGRFFPANVTVLNPDMRTARDVDAIPPLPFGFDYADLLGEDGVLTPQELSGAKTWIFHVPGLASFSFEAHAIFGTGPESPVISGILFIDTDENGRYDASDEPYPGGHVQVRGPDGFRGAAHSGSDGRYVATAEQPGLYTLEFNPFLDNGPLGCFTTPNPLEVVLAPGPGGGAQSFHHADFGIRPGSCPPADARVILTDMEPDEIEQDVYQLGGAELMDDRFRMLVEFSGCQPDHPFTLYVSRGFTGTDPVQTWALLAHDDLDEPCDAAFSRTLEFDLAPLRQAYVERYGEPGEVRVLFQDYWGNRTGFLFGP